MIVPAISGTLKYCQGTELLLVKEKYAQFYCKMHENQANINASQLTLAKTAIS